MKSTDIEDLAEARTSPQSCNKYILSVSILLLSLLLFTSAFAQPQMQLGSTAELKDALPKVEPLKNPLHAAANETTVDDQTDLAVTVYNNNRALVRDRRSVKLLPGEVALRFSDVAAQIMPETVSLKSLTAAKDLQVLEQNYEYDLMSPEKLMEKYVGKDVKLISLDTKSNFNEVNAKLLSVNNGPVYEAGGEIYLGHPGNVVLPEIPEELIAKPSLIWLLNNEATDHDIEATYLTNGISWRADYVATLDKDEKKMGLEGWVTLDNQSGVTYGNAQLKLVAGAVNVVEENRAAGGAIMADKAVEMNALGYFAKEESFAEYHLYTMPRRTTVKQNQSKQVRLLTASEVSTRKIYEYRGQVDFYSNPMPKFEPESPSVYLLFKNDEASHLGMPLPGGVLRVYQQDQDGMLQFSGEDRVEHTPKDEEVRLKLGQAFDIKAERKQTDFQILGPQRFEAEFEIVVRNHKSLPIAVDIVEPMPADWEVIKKSQEFVKKDAFTAVFTVPVPVDGAATVNYRVRVRM